MGAQFHATKDLTRRGRPYAYSRSTKSHAAGGAKHNWGRRDGEHKLGVTKHLAPQILSFNHRRKWQAFVGWCRVPGGGLYGGLTSALYDFLQKHQIRKSSTLPLVHTAEAYFCLPFFWIGKWRGLL